MAADFLGEYHELFLLFFLGVKVGFEGEFCLVGLSTDYDAVNDAGDLVCGGGKSGDFAEAAFHAPTVFSHFTFRFLKSEGREPQRFGMRFLILRVWLWNTFPPLMALQRHSPSQA